MEYGEPQQEKYRACSWVISSFRPSRRHSAVLSVNIKRQKITKIPYFQGFYFVVRHLSGKMKSILFLTEPPYGGFFYVFF